MSTDQLKSLLAQLDDYFDSIAPPSERTDLDDFALKQAFELEAKIDDALYQNRKQRQSVDADSSSQIVSASRDHMGI